MNYQENFGNAVLAAFEEQRKADSLQRTNPLK
jgi:hypothetical protein